MTKKDLFRIIIKLFGLYIFFQLTYSIVSFLFSATYYLEDLFSFALVLSPMIIYTLLAFVLVFKTDKIISFLKLEKGYDSDEINIGNINSQALIKIGLVIIGGLLAVNNISPFLTNTFLAFKASIKKISSLDEILSSFDLVKINYTEWITSSINIILGYLILTNFSRISKWLFKEKVEVKKNEIDQF